MVHAYVFQVTMTDQTGPSFTKHMQYIPALPPQRTAAVDELRLYISTEIKNVSERFSGGREAKNISRLHAWQLEITFLSQVCDACHFTCNLLTHLPRRFSRVEQL